jgi:hypothetical protein
MNLDSSVLIAGSSRMEHNFLRYNSIYSAQNIESESVSDVENILNPPCFQFQELIKLHSKLLSPTLLDAFPYLILDWNGLEPTYIPDDSLEKLKAFRF